MQPLGMEELLFTRGEKKCSAALTAYEFTVHKLYHEVRPFFSLVGLTAIGTIRGSRPLDHLAMLRITHTGGIIRGA